MHRAAARALCEWFSVSDHAKMLSDQQHEKVLGLKFSNGRRCESGGRW